MSGIDMETTRKLRDMGATALLEAIDAEDEHGPDPRKVDTGDLIRRQISR